MGRIGFKVERRSILQHMNLTDINLRERSWKQKLYAKRFHSYQINTGKIHLWCEESGWWLPRGALG